MVLSGAIKAEEISLKEYFGDFIYKWVREDLTSHYDRTFQYVIGEEAVAEGNSCWGGGQLWFTSLELAPKTNYNGTTLLQCEYQIEDFLGFSGEYFLFKKAKPVRIISNEELATLISIPPVSDNSDRLCF